MPNAFRTDLLAPDTHMGAVTLRVADLDDDDGVLPRRRTPHRLV